MFERFGQVPADVLPMLREAGRLVADLDQLSQDLEAARASRRRRDQARCRRQLTIARTQLVTLERHLDERLQRRPKGSRLAAHLTQPTAEGRP
jgi:hypothetical protein